MSRGQKLFHVLIEFFPILPVESRWISTKLRINIAAIDIFVADELLNLMGASILTRLLEVSGQLRLPI